MDPQTPQPITPAPSPQSAAPTPMGGGKKNKGLLIGIIAAAVLLIAGAGWAVYALFLAATPDSLMKDALKNLSQANTIAVDFSLSGPGADISGNVAATTDSANKNSEAILTFGEGDKSIALRILTVDDSLFLKASNVELAAPLLALYSGSSAFGSSEFIEALKNINGIWFEITKEQLDTAFEDSATPTTTPPTTDDLKKVLQIYDQHPFVKPDKVYPDEAVKGRQSAHFSLVIDKQKQVAFLEALKAANIDSIKLTDEEIAKIKESSDTQTGSLEVWIARDTKTFTKVKLVGPVQDQEVTVTLTAASPPSFDALERPTDARPISELMGIIFGYSYSSMTDLESLESELY